MSLEKWTEEAWTTQEGDERVRRGGETARYLPKEVWEKLRPRRKKDRRDKEAHGLVYLRIR